MQVSGIEYRIQFWYRTVTTKLQGIDAALAFGDWILAKGCTPDKCGGGDETFSLPQKEGRPREPKHKLRSRRCRGHGRGDSIPARHISEGAAPCPYCLAPCPIIQRLPESIKKKV